MNILKQISIFILYVCFSYTYLRAQYLCLVLVQAERGCHIPWNWNYRWLWVALYGQTQVFCKSSVLNYWTISYMNIFTVCWCWRNVCLQPINPTTFNFWSRDPESLTWKIWITFTSDSLLKAFLFCLMLKRVPYSDAQHTRYSVNIVLN